MRRLGSLAVSLLIAVLATREAAAKEPSRVSPLLVRPPEGKLGAHLRAPIVPVTIRFVEPLGGSVPPALLAKLASAGARPVELSGGGHAIAGRVLSARADRSRLSLLARLPGVVRIEPAVPLMVLHPLDRTTTKVGAPRAWSPPLPDLPALGEGVLIADHEGGWDPFHPDFFRPETPLYVFEDTNGDGKLGPGDEVDLDRDGVAEAPLALLEGVRDDFYTGEMRYAEPGYQPDVDWLYVDSNRNRRRDFGAGFDESTPALGEPIFVGDDINRDGRVTRGERLVRLGEPKVRAIHHEGRLFERGRNLTQYPVGSIDPSHGTGAAGVVAGGWPELRRYTGIAPGVDLAFIFDEDMVAGLAASRRLGARIDFFEVGIPLEAHDGSSNLEVAITDAARGGHATEVTAAGNLAGSDHCMEVGPVGVVPVRVRFSTAGPYPFGVFALNLAWLGSPEMSVALEVQGRGRFDLPRDEIAMGSLVGVQLQTYRQTTSKGTHHAIILAGDPNGGQLPELTFELVLSSSASVPLVRGLLFDDQSGWQKGVSWLERITDRGTALMPSTADQVIAVGAYGGNHDLSDFGWGAPDERRAYSGTGPRIDGARVVDIAAPDDPYAPQSDAMSPHGAYGAFGGTSGALPHVAGAAALLLGTQPGLDHAGVERALFGAALVDRFTGRVPNEEFGHGKLDVARAVLGLPNDLEPPPLLRLLAPATAPLGAQFDVIAEVSDPNAQIAWDLDYDRVYEPPGWQGSRSIVADRTGTIVVVAKAILPSGRSARAFAVIEIVESVIDGGGAPPPRDAGIAEPPIDSGVIGRDGPVWPRTEAGFPGPDLPDADPWGGDGSIAKPRPLDLPLAKGGGCGCSAARSSGDRDGFAALLLLLALAPLARRVRRPPISAAEMVSARAGDAPSEHAVRHRAPPPLRRPRAVPRHEPNERARGRGAQEARRRRHADRGPLRGR